MTLFAIVGETVSLSGKDIMVFFGIMALILLAMVVATAAYIGLLIWAFISGRHRSGLRIVAGLAVPALGLSSYSIASGDVWAGSLGLAIPFLAYGAGYAIGTKPAPPPDPASGPGGSHPQFLNTINPNRIRKGG